MEITQPQLLRLSCYDTKLKQSLNYSLFISPGDQLSLVADMLQKENQVVVTGRGSNNNQPLSGDRIYYFGDKFYGDTIPNRVISAILKEEQAHKVKLDNYISAHHPSQDFILTQRANLDYWAINAYFGFKENNKYQIKEPYKRNFHKWQAVQDSLIKAHPLDNPQALSAPTYTNFISTFLLREKERLWNQENENKTAFYKEWYGGDQLNGQKEYMEDMSNLLREKIINKYFKGKTAEYLHAYLITNAIEESNPKNLLKIHDRFQRKFLNSQYNSLLVQALDTVKKRLQGLNEHMVFVDSTGTQLNTFADLLAVAKGKTVLVDMWGTWCTPCRQEIETNGAEIKKHFKGKDLEFFYVANYDTKNAKAWKELIAYFNLEGTHILANQKLTDEVMATVRGSGFPTYFVIKKDGSFELSKAGYPMNRLKLIKQLEDALNPPK